MGDCENTGPLLSTRISSFLLRCRGKNLSSATDNRKHWPRIKVSHNFCLSAFLSICIFSGNLVCKLHEKAELFAHQFNYKFSLSNYPVSSTYSSPDVLFLSNISTRKIGEALCSLHDFTPHIPDGISLMVRSWFFVWFPFSVLSKFHWKRRKFPIPKHDYLTLAAKVEFPAQLPFRKYLKLSFPTQCVQSLSAKDRWETA